jgi:excisionase family DNA binding protein
MESQDDDQLLKIGEAGQILNVSPRTLRDWVERGYIECVRLPSGHRRFKKSDIENITVVQEPAWTIGTILVSVITMIVVVIVIGVIVYTYLGDVLGNLN